MCVSDCRIVLICIESAPPEIGQAGRAEDGRETPVERVVHEWWSAEWAPKYKCEESLHSNLRCVVRIRRVIAICMSVRVTAYPARLCSTLAHTI